ncbi:hypothetical protein C8R41DRAFT_868454 [Lentinula lateritia]|uniref:Uncharacterized protein n=1 Tax=Lentinula lateritia TaxID=40482 RepID=A0ABQ8VG48_9AGAR|nr:hypothetical protein C8R41DRAFT_868454 [Lentinula lateritia]
MTQRKDAPPFVQLCPKRLRSAAKIYYEIPLRFDLYQMFLQLCSICAVLILLLWSCSSPMAAPTSVSSQLTGVKVKLIRSYRGVILDSSADITPCTPTEVALGCTSTFEQWRILIDSLLYKADKNGDQLKASRDKDASIQRIQGARVLILGQLEFPNLQWKKTVLKDLLKVEVGGIFEYLDGIVKKLRDSPHTQCKWTSDQRDKYSKTWDAMYEKVEVPI